MVSTNFIPEAVQSARLRRRRITLWSTLALFALAVLAVPAAMQWMRETEVARLRERHERIENELAVVRTELKTASAQAERARVQLERAKALAAKRTWSAVLALIGRCMPKGCWLTTVSTDPPNPAQARGTRTASGAAAVVPTSGASGRTAAPASRRDRALTRTHNAGPSEAPLANVVIEAPRRLALTGYAENVAEPHEFVANLKQSGVFSEVVLVRASAEPGRNKPQFRFELQCEW